MIAPNLEHNISDVVVLIGRKLLSAVANDDLVSGAAILLFVVAMELVIAHHPYAELCVVPVPRHLDL